MNIKIWPLDKLQRIVSTINDEDPSAALKASTAAGHGSNMRGGNAGASVSRAQASPFDQDSDLSRALRHDRLNKGAPPPRDIVPFKGPFIYVHCSCESTKPVMVREYPKATKRQDGIWPQFRSASLGKCPFVEEPTKAKPTKNGSVKSKQIPQQQDPQRQEKNEPSAAKPIHPSAVQPAPTPQPAMPEMRPMRPPEPKRTASAISQNDVTVRHEDEENRQPPSPRQAPFAKKRCISHLNAVEPVASGIQQSNITSAIQSQNVSSAAAASGVKAATSREINELKRKVLEKNVPMPPGVAYANTNMGVSATSHSNNPPANYVNDDPNNLVKTATTTNASGAARDPPVRAPVVLQEKTANMKAKSRNPTVAKDANPPISNGTGHAAAPPMAPPNRKISEVKHDPKPGYCENCRDKFDDFDEVSTHTAGGHWILAF